MEYDTQPMFAHSNHSVPKPIIKIKTEQQKLNQDKRDQNSKGTTRRLWTEQDVSPAQETANNVDTEDFSNKIGDSPDYISENCIKVENTGDDNLAETNSTFFNQEHRNYAFIKKELNCRDHSISRTNEDGTNAECQQNGSGLIKQNSELLSLGCGSDRPEIIKIKTEPVDDLRKEININFEVDVNDNTKNNSMIWSLLGDTYLSDHEIKVEQENEDFNETSSRSEYFLENCHEKRSNVCLNEVESKYLNTQEHCVFIKEDIDLEDHCIKLELERHKGKTENTMNFRQPHFECHLCEYKTRIKDNLEIHSRWHADPNTQLWFYCTKCSFKTKQKGHLKRHDVTHRQPGEVQMFICAICNYEFKQKCSLRRHIYNIHVVPRTEIKLSDTQTQSGDTELFTCGVCDYKFKEKCSLRRHIYNVHVPQTEIKPGDVPIQLFQCDHCSYATFKKGLLLSHLDKHKDTGDPTNLYICDACSFSTKYRRNLRVHLETHKDSHQVYECDICEFKTRILYCLKRHFLTKKHLKTVGKLEQYSPRSRKSKAEKDS